MKKCLKKAIAVAGAVSMFLSMGVYAEEKEEKLYEKYPYEENFEYDDVSIGYALRTVVPKIWIYYTAELSYKPVKVDTDAAIELVLDKYEDVEGDYSDDEIDAILLEHLENNTDKFISYGKKKKVETSGGGMGSGVVISDDGYIATNAHVAAMSEENKLTLYLSGLETGVQDDVDKIFDDLSERGISFTDEDVDAVHQMVLLDAASKAEVEEEETQLYVQFPTSDGLTDMDSGIMYEAEVVEEGTQEGIESLTQDTAILKIDAENLVALKLSESYPDLNSEIVSAGFPAAADEAFQNAGSNESVLSVTVNSGGVSRLIPIEDCDYKAIEVSTRISGGNSGGPSVDTGLEIEGLNTYVFADDNRYAYMVSAEYVADLAEDCDIEQGEASKTFLLGVQMLQNDYGKTALECFEKVQELQPDTPFIEEMIEKASDAPQEEYSLSWAKSGAIDTKFIIIAGACVAILAGVVVIIVSVVKVSKKKNNNNFPPIN